MVTGILSSWSPKFITLLGTGILAMKDGAARTTLKDAMDETEMVIFDVVENLLRNNNVDPQEVSSFFSLDATSAQETNSSDIYKGYVVMQIDAVIVSCSCFAPTPSMAAMLVNHFKFRRDVLTYNLSGMGCSSSLICVDLAKHLLQALKNKAILIVNHENITQNWYIGNDRSMLVCNCLFRVGGAAALVTNRYR